MATNAHASIDQLALDAFGSTLGGELVRPGDDRYDERRQVWNASIDRYPALIARCAGVADVIDAVRFARTTTCSSQCAAAATATPATACATAWSSTCP